MTAAASAAVVRGVDLAGAHAGATRAGERDRHWCIIKIPGTSTGTGSIIKGSIKNTARSHGRPRDEEFVYS